jgi:hypothetical protein
LANIPAMKKTGALVTLLLVSAIIFGLFHNTILHANRMSLANGGDGFKSTFCTIYHIRHDSTYWHTGAMNYPFGESVFFTDNQVPLTTALKLLKDAGADLSDYAMGISNLLILLSYVIASLFIYLIFMELKMEVWLAVPASVLIILLSNQWERLGGHYTLAYAYVIPVILYLLLRFYRRPGYLLSAIFGIVVILFSAKHLYITAFILVLWIPYWIFLPLHDRERFGRPLFILSHLLIQFILPFALYSLFTGMHDPGLDRTAFPWGFYPSRVRFSAVFLPVGYPHGRILPVTGVFRMQAYVGMLGTLAFLYILLRAAFGLVRKKGWDAFAFTGTPAWNVLFWASVASLLLALGLPFSLKWESLLNYTGPFRQFRAIGRFVFPFYYTMTITSFLLLAAWYRKSGWKYKQVLLVAAFLVAGSESWLYIRKWPARYCNPVSWHSRLYHFEALPPWPEEEPAETYQAILPLPYFHIGSENYWVGDGSPVITPAYAASLETGLPLCSVMLSRTSIRQTLKNLDLVWEPYVPYPVVKDFRDNRPLLLLVHRKGTLTVPEKGLVRKGIPVAESDEVAYYRLEIDSLLSLVPERRAQLLQECHTSQEPEGMILFQDYSDREGGVWRSEFRKPVTFFDGLLPDTGQYLVSFWFEGADRDLWPRTNFWTELYREDSTRYLYSYTDFFRKMVLRDSTWGLIEYPLHVTEPGSRLKITMRNKVITGGEMVLDRVLVRPAGSVHMVREPGDGLWINNRLIGAEGPDPEN